MSYLSKTQSLDNDNIIWPGFVDVLASTLMVIIFIVLLFTVAQVYLGDLVVGKNQQIQSLEKTIDIQDETIVCLLYTSPSPRDATLSRMPSSA